MRDLIVYVLIVLVYRVESRTFCDDSRCVCVNKENILRVTCSAHPKVLEANYSSDTVSVLDLSHNNISRVERSPSLASETLRQLLLVNNQIIQIGVDVFRLPSLQLLDLSYNELEFVHRDAFASIRDLEYLNLANNKLHAFGNVNFYHLTTLKHIVLDNNDIGPSLDTHGLFKGYELTHEIQSISLRNVQLSSFEGILINGTSNLKNLTLAQNNISSIPDLPQNWEILEYLDISSNPIEKIKRTTFVFSIYLRELKLNDILIKEVPDFAFFYLILLQNLELANNTRLRKIGPQAWGWIIWKDQTDLFLENLSLRGSNLTSLDAGMEGIFKKIQRVDLRDNPWRCDCSLSWLQNVGIPQEFSDIRCSTPQHLFNRSILELNVTEFGCVRARAEFPEDYVKTSINVVVYCTLLVITVLMVYFFIFSPRHFMYRQLPVEFPRTP